MTYISKSIFTFELADISKFAFRPATRHWSLTIKIGDIYILSHLRTVSTKGRYQVSRYWYLWTCAHVQLFSFLPFPIDLLQVSYDLHLFRFPVGIHLMATLDIEGGCILQTCSSTATFFYLIPGIEDWCSFWCRTFHWWWCSARRCEVICKDNCSGRYKILFEMAFVTFQDSAP